MGHAGDMAAYAHSGTVSSWWSSGRRVALRRNAEIVAIGTVAPCFLCRIQTELCQSIAVCAVAMLGVLRQIPPHARFGFLREGATKRGIDALHRADGIAGERLIVHITEATVRRRMPVAELDGVLEYLGPVTGGFKANVEGIHMIAERTLQHCAQASE